jgi:hypothetical protein
MYALMPERDSRLAATRSPMMTHYRSHFRGNMQREQHCWEDSMGHKQDRWGEDGKQGLQLGTWREEKED